MATKTIKIRLKGHESFYIREGWLRKGIKAIVEDPLILTKANAVDELGVGANMVKAIRYWLQAVGLTEEYKADGLKRAQRLTKDFGAIIVENDKFFEDKFTLLLMHYKLASNFNIATSWNLFFNKVNVKEFTRSNLVDIMDQKLKNIDTALEYSNKSLVDDCNCIIQTYLFDSKDLVNPEDNMICPFSELELLKRIKVKGKEDIILKNSPSREVLNKYAILYVIIDRAEEKTTSIDKLMEEDCNIGKVFNLDKNTINEYLDELEVDGYLSVNRTAGLNTIYLNEISKEEVLRKYYSSK